MKHVVENILPRYIIEFFFEWAFFNLKELLLKMENEKHMNLPSSLNYLNWDTETCLQ